MGAEQKRGEPRSRCLAPNPLGYGPAVGDVVPVESGRGSIGLPSTKLGPEFYLSANEEVFGKSGDRCRKSTWWPHV